MNGDTSQDTLVKRRNDLVATLQRRADQSAQGSAVFLGDDNIVGDVYQTTRQITGVGSLHGRIGKTLASAV